MQTYNYRQHNKKSLSLRIKLYFTFLILTLLVIGIFYLVFFSRFFKIKEIKVENNKRLTKDEILTFIKPVVFKSWLINFLGEHNILAWKNQDINLSATLLGGATIKREWANRTITIDAQERQWFAVWCILDGQKCYWVDKYGVIFDEAPLTEGSLIPVVFDSQKNDLVLGTKTMEDRFINDLDIILNNLPKIGFLIKKTAIDRDLEEVRVQIYNGPDILFSLRFNPEINIGALNTLNQKNDLKNIEYIDLRAENKLFIKNL